jgi:hypothetical protein
MRFRVWCLFVSCMASASLWGQAGDPSEARFKALEDRMHELEALVQALQTALAAAGRTAFRSAVAI